MNDERALRSWPRCSLHPKSSRGTDFFPPSILLHPNNGLAVPYRLGYSRRAQLLSTPEITMSAVSTLERCRIEPFQLISSGPGQHRLCSSYQDAGCVWPSSSLRAFLRTSDKKRSSKDTNKFVSSAAGRRNAAIPQPNIRALTGCSYDPLNSVAVLLRGPSSKSDQSRAPGLAMSVPFSDTNPEKDDDVPPH